MLLFLWAENRASQEGEQKNITQRRCPWSTERIRSRDTQGGFRRRANRLRCRASRLGYLAPDRHIVMVVQPVGLVAYCEMFSRALQQRGLLLSGSGQAPGG